MIESFFDLQSVKLFRGLSKVINAHGANIFLVGGAVRDLLLGKTPTDVDIAVIGDVISLIPIIRDNFFCKVIKTQPELKTARIDFENHICIDFASTRRELYGEKKGIPVPSHFGCSLKDDVLRRDFTVNALAISLNSYNFGQLIDFVGGQKDLENKVLRVLHDNSFNDDPTRIIRAFKFAHRLGFKIEEHTQELQDKYLQNKNYNEVVSPMRIKKEMYDVFSIKYVEIIKDFVDKGIYKVMTDKINDIDLYKAKQIIYDYNITENIPYIYFMSLFFREENFPIIRQFNLTKQEVKVIHDVKFATALEGKLSDIDIYRIYSSRTKESLAIELLLKENANIKRYLEKLADVKIEIAGEDLFMLGVPESSMFSTIFDKVMEEKIKGNLPDKSSELRFVRQLLLNHEV